MAYRLVQNNGDSIAVPQLVFAKLPEIEDDWLRVALSIIATGETDPAVLARTLHLKGPEKARDALVFWKGAGLLESCGETAPRDISAAPAPRARLTTREISAAAQNDPSIAALVQECQALMGGVIPEADTNIFVSMYLTDGMPVDLILLGVAHFVSLGKRSARYIERALHGWQRDGIDSGAAAERYLQQLALRQTREIEVARILKLPDAKFTKAERGLIADWYENFGYDDGMVAEAAAYAGEKNTVRYLNGILRAWHTKGYRSVRDVMAESAATTQNVQPAGSNPMQRDVLKNGLKRAPTFKKQEVKRHE